MSENEIVTLACAILMTYEELLPVAEHTVKFADRLAAMIATIKRLQVKQ